MTSLELLWVNSASLDSFIDRDALFEAARHSFLRGSSTYFKFLFSTDNSCGQIRYIHLYLF